MAKKGSTDVLLVVFAIFGFLGLDKLYKSSIPMFLIKLICFLAAGSLVTWVPGIGRILGSIFGFVLIIWWLADIVFAIVGKYRINPLDYLRK